MGIFASRTYHGVSGPMWLAIGLAVIVSSMAVERLRAQQPNAPTLHDQTLHDQALQAQALQAQAEARAFIKINCVRCHNERRSRGDLDLAALDLADIGAHARVWEKVVVKLGAGLMPPLGSRRPSRAKYEGFQRWLAAELDRVAAKHPNPGPNPVVHRLNRAQYQNAVRDLLRVDIDAARFLPADDSSHGFDNMAGTLRISSLLMERYLAAAKAISRLAVGSNSEFESRTYFVESESERRVRTGETALGTEGGTEIRHYFPRDGLYEMTVTLERTNRPGQMFVDSVNVKRELEIAIDGVQAGLFTIGAPRQQHQRPKFNIRFPVSAGEHHISARYFKLPSSLVDGLREPRINERGVGDVTGSTGSLPRLLSLMVDGPLRDDGPGDTASRREIFTSQPASPEQEPACAREILARLSRRAYRGNGTDEDVETLMQSYDHAAADGGTFESGIEFAIRRMLVSPSFLFRIEADSEPTADGPRPVSDIEMASRLSFFLWSSIPDEPLLDAAGEGRLRTPDEIEQQVRRMLADPRSRALTTNFASQWLELPSLAFYKPAEPYSLYYDDSLRDSLQRETELFVDHVIRENAPVSELLTARYSFLNKRLADHYGISGVQHPDLRRVDLPRDSPRGGLLGHGSLLTITSHPDRTSPVLRGKWVLANLMGTPPPPPPPDVPALEEKKPGVKPPTLREQLSLHRSKTACASCHDMIDPAGFALEHFDAIGRWRDRDGALNPIDSSAVLPDGTHIDGAQDLKAALVQKPERFANTVAERMLTYALGRGLEHYDAPSVRRIVANSAQDGYRIQSLIVNVAQSYPFVTRSGMESAKD